MGESAKILNPDKTVLMPDASADCPMAHMVDRSVVDAAREQYEDLAVVCYINSTAEIKSWSDVCVTSANAVKIVRNLPNKNILLSRTETWDISWQSRRRRNILFITKATARDTNLCPPTRSAN